MQAVRSPGAGVGERGHAPQVDDRAATAFGARPHQLVVAGDAAAQAADQRVHPAQVEAGEDEHLRARGGDAGERGVEAASEVVGVAGDPDDVVAARAERHEVRAQALGHRDLVGDDLVEHLAAHRQVGVAEVGLVRGKALGDAIGPATGRAVGAPVVEALGEAVTDRDERPPAAHAARPLSVHLLVTPANDDYHRTVAARECAHSDQINWNGPGDRVARQGEDRRPNLVTEPCPSPLPPT